MHTTDVGVSTTGLNILNKQQRVFIVYSLYCTSLISCLAILQPGFTASVLVREQFGRPSTSYSDILWSSLPV